MEIKLGIYGVIVLINSDKKIIDLIKNDYNAYLTKEANNPDLTFNLYLKKPHYNKIPELKAKKYHQDYIVYDSKNIRIIDYFGKALVIYEIKEKTLDIYCKNKDKLYSIFTLAFESLLGEELDKKGFHRIHALNLEKQGKAIILLLPPGAGKTTLASKFKDNKIKILSEDLALYKNKKIYGLHSKHKKYHNLAEKANPYILILGKRVSSEKSKIRKISKSKLILPLFKSMVLGLELQQSLAYFLLRNYKEAFSKTNIGFSRFKALFSLLLKTKTYEFEMGYNIEKNYLLLKKFLGSI